MVRNNVAFTNRTFSVECSIEQKSIQTLFPSSSFSIEMSMNSFQCGAIIAHVLQKINKKSIWFASVHFERTLFCLNREQAHSLSPFIQKKTKHKNTSRCDCCKTHKVTHNLLWSFSDQWSSPYWSYYLLILLVTKGTYTQTHLHSSRLSAGWWP